MKKIVCAFVFLLLAACQDAPRSTEIPLLTLSSVKEVGLDVARIEIVEKYASPMKEPHVEHLFKQVPATIVRRMAEEKLRAQGSLHTLRVIVEDASVVRKDLPVREGINGWFYKEPSESYYARVVLRFELLDDNAPHAVIGNALVVSERERTLLEDTSPADRDMTFFNMTEDIIHDIDTGFHGVVRQTFGWK